MMHHKQAMANELSRAELAEFYRFLSRSMEFPDAAWLDDAYCSALCTLLDSLGWQKEAQEIRHLSQAGSLLGPLQIEYTRLFLNAVPHVIAPPYGSVYLSDDGMLYGQSAVLTKRFYQEHGFDLPGEADIPDHLTLELEFLALLAEEGCDDGESFLRLHLRPWFSQFRARVLAEVRHPFYRVMVNLIDFFTREELDNGFGFDET